MSKDRVRNLLRGNSVTWMFLLVCIVAFLVAEQPLSYVMSEVLTRLFRNGVLVLSLIIPVVAGIGLNFGIVLGAMSAQCALILVTMWGVRGILGMLTAVAVSTPLSLFLGMLLGKLFNKTKGQEMVTGLIIGFFANGIYQFIFMIVIGPIIHVNNSDVIMEYSGAIKDTILLDDSMRGVLDNIWNIPLRTLVLFSAAVGLAYLVFLMGRLLYGAGKKQEKMDGRKLVPYGAGVVLILAVLVACYGSNSLSFAVDYCRVPVVPLLILILIGWCVRFVLTTKLGQDFRAVGQDMTVANSSGIDVEKRRIQATMLSTLLAALGQLMSLQNLGNFPTYTSHESVGTFAVAALLVGGASTRMAKVSQAIIGVLLFHTLFVISPNAGKNLLGDPTYGEYFRTFVSYGIIAVSLFMHVANTEKEKNRTEE